MNVELIEQYATDLFNIKEALKSAFRETGNPTLPRIVEMALDVVRQIDELEWEITKILKSSNVF